MTKDQIVVKRYAEAYVGFAEKGLGLDKIIQDFTNLKNILQDNLEFQAFLEGRGIAHTKKCELIDKVLQEDFSGELRQFLKLLLEKGRVDKILDIAEYVRARYSHGGRAEALIKTAYLLNPDLIKLIQEKIEKKFQKKFKFYIDLDGSLLGGIQVIIGNTVIDGSVRKRLEQLREQLKAVQLN